MERPASQTEALVIGQGSIGRRHARLLAARGMRVATVSAQPDTGFPNFATIDDALRATAPAYAVVATATARHPADARALAAAGFRGRLLIEKPLAAAPEAVDLSGFAQVAVAYNLRFHPALEALRAHLRDDPARLVRLHCGQHLSGWRPGRDFRQGYSADAAQGGGALRDLSHDLNYLEWLVGPADRVAALGGNLGILGIRADEAWSILLHMRGGAHCAVTLNYLDRPARREVVVTTARATLTLDLVAGRLAIDDAMTDFPAGRDDTYIAMHEAMFGPADPRLCSLEAAQRTDRLIAAIEASARSGAWTTLDEGAA